MIKRVFFDTNLLLDLLDERPGFETVAQILQLHSDERIHICVSVLSLANIAYVLRKRESAYTIPTLKQIAVLLDVLPIDAEQFDRALMLDGPDFEDLLQASCAITNGCECIVTRNVKDFKIKPGLKESQALPPVYSPSEFLELYHS